LKVMLERALPVDLKELINRDISLPVCPVVFTSLLSALGQADSSCVDLAEILQSDATLASQVLRAANSAVYGLPRQVRSIDEAIFRIGFKEVWSISSALKARELFRTQNQPWSAFNAKLWDHTLLTAALARVLVTRCKLDRADELFTAALLHDIGKAVLYQVTPDYAVLCQNASMTGHELSQLENDFFGTNHAKLGAELLRHWNLPETLADLVAKHHDEPGNPAETGRRHHALVLANEFAHALALSADNEQGSLSGVAPDSRMAVLEIPVESCPEIALDALKQLQALRTA
jgi:putative nucleotidyltransferase with HDIG domain